MANQEERDASQKSKGSSTGERSETGDPGRTPGTAEGDEQTIDEDLKQKSKEGQQQQH